MIIKISKEESKVVIQKSLKEILELSTWFKEENRKHRVQHYDTFGEIVIPFKTHDTRKTFMNLMKQRNFNHTLLKYDFNHMERKIENLWKEGFTQAINEKYNQKFNHTQSAMRYYADTELDRLGVEASFRGTPLYFSLLSTMMAEIISRKGYLSGLRFIADNPLDAFARFYHSFKSTEIKRLQSLSIDALLKLGYVIF